MSQPGQDFNIVTNPMLEQFRFLQNTYEEWGEVIEEEGIDESREKLEVAEELLDENYSEEAIHDLLSEFKDRDWSINEPNQSIYMSAVINQIGDETISIEPDNLSELTGLEGLGYRNKTDVTIEGDIYENIFRENIAGNVNIEGDINSRVGEEMMGGTIKVNGDVTGTFGIGRHMQGGRIIVEGYVEKAGTGMKNGFVRVTEEAEKLGKSMEGGEIGSEQSVEKLANSAKGGIAWVNDDAEEVGNYAKGGLIYVAGDAEEIGERSRDGEIYIEGEIGNIGERCGADVYQWRDGEWELVHEGEDRQPRRNQGKSKSTSTPTKTSRSSSEIMEHEESYEELEEMNNILEYDDDDFGFYDEESYETKTKEAPTGLAEKVEELDPLSEKPIEEQLRDEE